MTAQLLPLPFRGAGPDAFNEERCPLRSRFTVHVVNAQPTRTRSFDTVTRDQSFVVLRIGYMTRCSTRAARKVDPQHGRFAPYPNDITEENS
jgi:hypothetical protein